MKTPEVNERNFYAEAREIEKTLKPCPFCGNKDIEFSLIHPQYWGKPDMDYWCYWEILCPECGAHMENARLDTQTWDEAKEEIIELWNQRYPAETAGHDRKEWKEAERNLSVVISAYKELGGIGTFGLVFLNGLMQRYQNGERTQELFDTMMEAE